METIIKAPLVSFENREVTESNIIKGLKQIVTVQRLYRSIRRLRQLADDAVLREQKWFKLLDDYDLKQNSELFFDIGKPNSVLSRWLRAKKRLSKVGKGFCENTKARPLVDRHWLEAIDPYHRYGYNLKLYFDHWSQCESNQNFFNWLDVGDGRKMSIDECPRSKLQQEKIKYLVAKEREAYEVIVEDGKFLYKLNRKLLNTSEGSKDTKWIFVLSTSKTLYCGLKKKGTFQHSSFLAGGVASAAGGIEIENGVLKVVTINSGHYHPGLKDLLEFVLFLDKNDVDMAEVKICPKGECEDITTEKLTSYKRSKSDIYCLQEINALVTKNRNSRTNHQIMSYDREPEQSLAVENKMSIVEIPEDTNVVKTSENECLPMGLCNNNVSPESQFGKRKFEEYHTEVVPEESILP